MDHSFLVSEDYSFFLGIARSETSGDGYLRVVRTRGPDSRVLSPAVGSPVQRSARSYIKLFAYNLYYNPCIQSLINHCIQSLINH